jgi:hypothetical protein
MFAGLPAHQRFLKDTMKAASNAKRGAYIHSVAGKKVFAGDDTVSAYADLRDRRVTCVSM